MDALRPLKAKAASLGALERELASKEELIASLQRRASAAARGSPRGASPAGADQMAAPALHRTSMEVITLQAEVSCLASTRSDCLYPYVSAGLHKVLRRSLSPCG